MKPSRLLFTLFFFCLVTVQAQLNQVPTERIDSLLLSWNEPNHPGGAIGIMHKGNIIYSKAFGLASLEYQVPNTPQTIFNTGSVSKQFTAMGIVLLHERGLLSIEDNIRKYLPDMPAFAEQITIKHMLHHTSGMRSLHAMLSLAGWRDDDSRTNADLYRFMLKQKELNFTPGDEYLYCNTGYMLMVNIIENVTKEKFPKWMKDNVFDPLGLTNTYVEDRYDRIVLNNATSYYGSKDNFFRAVEYWGYVGSGNMHSTTTDLLNWLQNFSNPPEKWASAFQLLQTTHPLNDGSVNNYAYGVNVNEDMGYKKVGHGGAIGGFRANVATYPEEQLSIAVLTNFSSSNPGGIVNRLAMALLPEKAGVNDWDQPSIKEFNSITLTPEQLQPYEGWYWNDKENYARRIYIKNDTLSYFRSEGNEHELVPVGTNEFKMLDIPSDLIVKFESDSNGNQLMLVTINDERPSRFEKFEPVLEYADIIQEYSGQYFSPELESILEMQAYNGSLFGHHARHGDFPINILKKDVLEIPQTAIIKIERNSNSEITGIRVSNGRARHVLFVKQ